jgi:hypothetical protein
MLTRIRRLPSPAFVIASIALILAVGGGSFALAITDKKSDKKIAKKVANKQITKRAPSLSVAHANSAGTANNLTNPEPYHEIGAQGEPAFENGAANYGNGFSTAGFFIDHEGVVHLKGTVSATGGTVIFTLPAGYRPSATLDLDAIGSGAQAYIYISSGGEVSVHNGGAGTVYGLDSITFRAGA